MPYNLFLTVRRSDEFSKAKVVFTGPGGVADQVFTVEDPEFYSMEQVLELLMGAVREHMAVRREAQSGR